jgi:hypothetical protein
MHNESIHRYLSPSCRVMMTASWNNGGRSSNGMLTMSLPQEDFVAINGVSEPQQCDRAIYWNALPCVSTTRIGFVDRPTSTSLLGADIDGSDAALHTVCFGFPRQPWMHRRMKLKDSSEPALVGIRCPAPSVGHGLRAAIVCQLKHQLSIVGLECNATREAMTW